jgi:hypothetical protein
MLINTRYLRYNKWRISEKEQLKILNRKYTGEIYYVPSCDDVEKKETLSPYDSLLRFFEECKDQTVLVQMVERYNDLDLYLFV